MTGSVDETDARSASVILRMATMGGIRCATVARMHSVATVIGVNEDADRHAAGDPAPFRERLHDAALAAEMLTGRGEETPEEAERALHRRLARGALGFALVALGIVLLPLPGPGWVIIVVGLTQLPFTWAERTVRLIRRRVPGIPEDGAIPTQTWVVMGALVVASTVVAIAWGDDLKSWVTGLW